MRVLILLLILLSGCACSEITDISPYLKVGDIKTINGCSVDDVKRHFFTDEAYELIKDIPLKLYPDFLSPHAGGTTALSTLVGVLSLNGPGRQVYIPEKALKDEKTLTHIIHEYIHQIDDIGRDGGPELIKLDEFQEGYASCYGHQQFHGIVMMTERYANFWFTDWFGIGDYAEHVAYVGACIATQACTHKLRWAFRKVLKTHEFKDIPP